jgi:hypothetical protein
MTKLEGTAGGASWKIEHVEEQLYDIFTYLPYTATAVKMRGPGVTNAHTVGEEEWRQDFDRVEPSEDAVLRAALTPRSTGSPAKAEVQISWSDPDEGWHSGWYDVPLPGRTNPNLKFT